MSDVNVANAGNITQTFSDVVAAGTELVKRKQGWIILEVVPSKKLRGFKSFKAVTPQAEKLFEETRKGGFLERNPDRLWSIVSHIIKQVPPPDVDFMNEIGVIVPKDPNMPTPFTFHRVSINSDCSL